MRRRWAWLWPLGCMGVALAVVLGRTMPSTDGAHLPLAAQRQLFARIAAQEPAFRAAAAAQFPGDAWSQDDDFHNQEQRLLRQLAAEAGVSVAAMLAIVDRGLREAWALPEGLVLRASVAPCRPRIDY